MTNSGEEMGTDADAGDDTLTPHGIGCLDRLAQYTANQFGIETQVPAESAKVDCPSVLQARSS